VNRVSLLDTILSRHESARLAEAEGRPDSFLALQYMRSSFDVPDLVAEVRRLCAQVRALEEHVARLMAADMPDPEGRGSR
jgi:hypothetical protein